VQLSITAGSVCRRGEQRTDSSETGTQRADWKQAACCFAKRCESPFSLELLGSLGGAQKFVLRFRNRLEGKYSVPICRKTQIGLKFQSSGTNKGPFQICTPIFGFKTYFGPHKKGECCIDVVCAKKSSIETWRDPEGTEINRSRGL